jgi:hypothetical protein
MRVDEIRDQARDLWQKNLPCPVCEKKVEVFDEDGIYTHILEHRVLFLEKVIKLYCDCDCDDPPKPGEPHWVFCRRRIGDDALGATLEQMTDNDCRK